MREKVFVYAKTFTSAHIVCRSSRKLPTAKVGSIMFYPLHVSALFFPVAAWLLGRRLIKRLGGSWVMSADNPFELGLVALLLSYASGGSLLVHVHTDFLSPFFRAFATKDRIRYWIGCFVVKRASCVRVVSERIKKSLLEEGLASQGSKITVLSIATDIERFLNAPRGTEDKLKGYSFKMIAVGRFVDKEKNFSMLISMMRDFIKTCPQSVLVLAGGGPDRENYKRQVASYKLERNVIIEQWREDLASFYKSFDVLLLSSNYEGWGRVALEAMAAGLPVIMTDVGVAGEVIKDGINGLVVPVGDGESFLKACLKLYKDSDLRIKFASRSQEIARGFLSANYMEDYSKIIANCG